MTIRIIEYTDGTFRIQETIPRGIFGGHMQLPPLPTRYVTKGEAAAAARSMIVRKVHKVKE